MPNGKMGRWRWFLASALAVLSAGCAHDKLVAYSNPPPAWGPLVPPPPKDGKVFLIGRSTAINSLDEGAAMRVAKRDAAYEAVSLAAQDVRGNFCIVDAKTGDIVRGKETTEGRQNTKVEVDVDAIVMGLTLEDAYWEKRSIREHAGGRKILRYLYRVMTSIEESELERIREDLKKKLRTD